MCVWNYTHTVPMKAILPMQVHVDDTVTLYKWHARGWQILIVICILIRHVQDMYPQAHLHY